MKDADLIVLPAPAAPVTANVTSPTFDLGEGAQLVQGQWSPGFGGAPMQLLVPITSYAAGGNQTYSAVVNESVDGTTWTQASPVRTPAADAVPTTGGLMKLGYFSRKRYVQLVITVGGTGPSIVLGDCYIDPLTNRFGA